MTNRKRRAVTIRASSFVIPRPPRAKTFVIRHSALNLIIPSAQIDCAKGVVPPTLAGSSRRRSRADSWRAELTRRQAFDKTWWWPPRAGRDDLPSVSHLDRVKLLGAL